MRRLVLAAAIAVLLSACASSASPSPSASAGPSVLPVFVSPELVVGANRFVFSFIDPATNAPVAKPDRSATVAFIAPGQSIPGSPVPGTFIWAIEGSTGDYVSAAEFTTAGQWTAVFTTAAPGKPQEQIAAQFDVQAKGATVAVGQPAPSVRTPTLADVGDDLKKISTDSAPDPRFYQTSIDAALAAHEPFVLVFATPAFCQTATCGPALDRVKAIAKTYPKVRFINVEPYKLAFTEGRLQPVLDAQGQLQTVEATDRYGLLSEPWIFVVDGQGIVRASMLAVFGDDELKAAIDAAQD